MRSMPRLPLFLLPLLAALSAHADEAKVDAYVRAEMQKRKIPGVSVAVVQDGKVVLARGYGLANLENEVPARPDTVYQLASVTKQFTAAAILLLAEEGKLSIDDPISRHLSDTPAAWSGVKIRHLLNHTSGIPSYTGLPEFKDPRRDYTHEELIGLVRGRPLEFQPGEKWAYNNSGYYLLGMIIERVSGKSYGDFLAERIFRPLGMSATRVNDRGALILHRADGYSRDASGVRRAEFTSPTQPFSAGALVSTVEDMAKWDMALNSDVPLKSALRDVMWTATKLNDGTTAGYGFGWSVGNLNGQRMVEHGGGIPGFSTQITRFPDLKLSVIVLTNLEGSHAGRLATGIAALYHPELTPKPAAAVEDRDPKSTVRIRAVLLALASGKADPEDFTPQLRQALFPDRVKEAQELFTQFGPLKELVLLESREEGGLLHRRYRATFGETNVSVAFALNKEGKIAGAGVTPE